MQVSPTVTITLGRLVQVSIALWLLPALLIVLIIGTIGILVLDGRRRLLDALTVQACHPQESAGLEMFRS